MTRYGTNPHGEQTVISEHEVPHCAIVIRSSAEPLNLRSEVVTTATLLAPYGADIRETDRVTQANGTRWDVVGKPADVKSPLTGWRPGQRSTLQHVSG
ncbi:hypothetical protein HUO13_12095 [Saccharopolyspora erythraea]|uniref:hypothetical protein n=1 Tax=Saccharopolyspora erythraea TaxID=1836 RepID=UPI001BA58460|nr:hypothetical protein [Saccharopolyspora erythraea]QUH01454.1 hypothetical protein HUO13_12095 [Saccharopolyspora erythraea]